MSVRPILAALMATTALTACRSAAPQGMAIRHEAPQEMCADTTSTPRVPLPQRDALAPRDPGRSPDYFFTTLAIELPGGFGGLYFEPLPDGSSRRRGTPEQQRAVIRLQDTTLAPDALEEMKTRLRAHYGPMLNLDILRLQPSRWSFAQLEEWWRYLTPTVFGWGSVSMADIDEHRNRVAFGVTTDSVLRSTRALLDTLGVPCGLVELRVVSLARATGRLM